MFDYLSNKFSSVFTALSGNNKLSEQNIQESLDQVKDALLEADVPYDLVTTFIDEVKQEALGNKVLKALKPGEQFIKVVHDRLKQFLGGSEEQSFIIKKPAILMVMGLQGSGKTTTLGKLAHWLKTERKMKSILLASVDFYRPAAVDQLKIVAHAVETKFYRSTQTDPVAAAQDIAQYARQQQFDVLLLDTAGRLHVDNHMLKELQDIEIAVTPSIKLLVLDAMTGQESLNVAKAFEQSVGFEGAILSKMDSDSRGGAVFSFRYALKKPVWFVGVGEKPEDFEQFKPDRIAGRILGMGDVVTLAEKAEKQISQHEQQSLEKSLMSGNLNLEDFAQHMQMMNRLGSLSQIMNYMPGMGGFKITPDMMQKGEQEMRSFKAIISSMTPKERRNPALLNGSRKQRIARGAGVTPEQINTLLARFQQTVKLFKKVGGHKGLFR